MKRNSLSSWRENVIDPHAYNITICLGEFEGEVCYEARVKELPDLTEYADTAEEVYELAIDSIQTTAEIFAEKGKAMPVPLQPADDYSGRITLRLPKSLHRALAQAAEEEDVSLNQHLVNILSYFSGFAAAQGGQGSTPSRAVPNHTKKSKPARRHSPPTDAAAG